jgi:uncharacterized protein (TIGR00106 family)
MSWLMFFSITPLGKGESVGDYVARAVDIIDRSGLDYRLTAVGTVLEADSWDDLARVISNCLEDLWRDCRRISVLIKVDPRAAFGRPSSRSSSGWAVRSRREAEGLSPALLEEGLDQVGDLREAGNLTVPLLDRQGIVGRTLLGPEGRQEPVNFKLELAEFLRCETPEGILGHDDEPLGDLSRHRTGASTDEPGHRSSRGDSVVEGTRLELATSSLRSWRSPN